MPSTSPTSRQVVIDDDKESDISSLNDNEQQIVEDVETDTEVPVKKEREW